MAGSNSKATLSVVPAENALLETAKARLFEASALMDTLKRAEEGGHIENVAAVTERLINEALDAIEKMEEAHHG